MPRATQASIWFSAVAALLGLGIFLVFGATHRSGWSGLALTVLVPALAAAVSARAIWRPSVVTRVGGALRGALIALLSLLLYSLVLAGAYCVTGSYLECVGKSAVLLGMVAAVPALVIGAATGALLAARSKGTTQA
jgi:hypothetical protein